ncbi:GH36-type glycosyl hydrolase domain-containing protein [Candidatus Binatus sp.]|uniref:GH36-type glycosyl hydrolase domain-containing protein n=1 Tax=Candidatus Binatus sp. TaxID=2811406 RepID=UPI002F929C40
MNFVFFRAPKKPAASFAHIDEPIRAELFSVERLEQHGETLAVAQRVTDYPGRGRPMAARVRDNGRVLLAAYRGIASAIREERAITPAAEWLVDNFHVVEEQIREIRDDLPRGFYRQLPKLADGPLEGYPRVFGIAWAYVAHTDSHFDPQTLAKFVQAYQHVQPLTIGELWAVAITLRIVLVENLRRLAEQMGHSRAQRRHADLLANRLLASNGRDAEPAEAVLKDLDKSPLSAPFAVEMVQRLRDQDPKVTPALRWLDQRLLAQGTTADEIVRQVHQGQGAMNVTVRNVITSMRLMSAVDWADFFESVSAVDAVLRAASDFAAMDFATRDRYRHAIEELARGSRHSEIEVAQSAIDSARGAASEVPNGDGARARREHHPGYYLISEGRHSLEAQLGFRAPVRDWIARANAAAGIAGYLGTIAVVTAIIVAGAMLAIEDAQISGWTRFILAMLAIIPATDAAVVIVNRAVTTFIGPAIIPALELHDGVPPSLRTMVVMPTLLTTRDELDEQIERLEVHYLASSDGELYLAILSDWTDSATETAPGDDDLLGAATAGIARLNQRHGQGPGGKRFLLLHRRRIWDEAEGVWMGWERKRGKLHELNRLLRGATDTTFIAPDGHPPAVPDGVRYVITLDADTRIPRGAAKRMVGKMAHPLNAPRFDKQCGRVVEGHGVLQPRITASLPTRREGSIFQRVFSSTRGMDPYAFAVSDVYQDLLDEGSYSGKGIYDVDMFEAALAGRVPDNALLSHDLFEGTFARSGLVSDIELVEEFPSRYDVAAARQHRWARGDWQLIPWILGHGSSTGTATTVPRDGRSSIPPLGRWKMIDNLRRTLSAPTALLALLAGWRLPEAGAAIWTGFIVATIATAPMLPFLTGIIPRRRDISKRSHIRAVVTDLIVGLSQLAMMLTLLAHQAWLMSDAISRTLYRLYVSHRLMLEWTTAAQAKRTSRLDVRGFYGMMAGAAVLGAAAAIFVAWAGHGGAMIAAPFVILWMLSPAVARWASLPPRIEGTKPLSLADTRELRLSARRTWRFFEKFVTAEDNMLPPDNFQEDPKPVLAHRTSPTNLGLYLLSVVAAHDFGWMGTHETAERLGATLDTMKRLEQFRGHFFNWYATRDLRPLDPRYVSSVDSGNLAGHLIALGNACREMIARPVVDRQWLKGIEDSIALVREALGPLAADRRSNTVTPKQLEEALDAIAPLIQSDPQTVVELAAWLAELEIQSDSISDIARALTLERADSAADDVLAWAEALRACIRSHRRDIELLKPWSTRGARDATFDDPATQLDSMPTLGDLPDLYDEAIGCLKRRNDERPADDATAGAIAAAPGSIDSTVDALARARDAAKSLERRLTGLAATAGKMFDAMKFDFLFDPARQLLSIGYRVTDGSLDSNCYDLLASEARLASFVAIAKGEVPVKHWFRLGRAMTPVDRGSALISWSGSMFEYLMPSLVMRAPAGSLLEQTNRLVVRRQMKYGAELGMPWGVSESAYNARDLELTYQYSNFGVPGLGLKRGLNENAVIAPYATALAAMVDPEAAAQNFSRLLIAGGLGHFGWYEALDYTPSRVPEGESVAIVRAYMAHHQGMTLVALADALNTGAMRRRFHAEPMIQATELLLQERTPRDVAVARPRAEEVKAEANVRESTPPTIRRFHSPHDLIPRTHLLSNGRYTVMITAAGSGFSRWRDMAVTRWHEDVTRDSWGTYAFIRDVNSGKVWSAGFQPAGVEPDSYEVEFSEDRAEIVRRDGSMTTTLEVAVSPEDDSEVRRVSISNLGNRVREVELTSYAEIVLAPEASDTAHPAFSKMFVQTEFDAQVGALLATRRLRSPTDAPVWAAHLAVAEGESVGKIQFETDRARFLGRGRDIRDAISVIDGRPLSDTVGTVLDPIFSVRRRLRIPAGATARVAFWTIVAPTRAEALDLVDKHHDSTAFERAVTLAWTQAQVQLHHLRVDADEAHLFQRIANRVLYSDPTLRPSSDLLKRGVGGQSKLWPSGISGDLPIVLVRIDEIGDLEIVRELVRAHEYWRMKRLCVDLVILNERPPSYDQELQIALEAMVRSNPARSSSDGQGACGNVFVLRSDLVSVELRNVLQTVARAVLLSRRGTLSEQVKRLEMFEPAAAPPPRRTPATGRGEISTPRRELEFFNGLGGFAADGHEYVTILGEGQWTPAPWINVIANPSFGFQVSVEGAGYTWAINSQQHQITQWSNDPVSDRPGEVIYVHDLDTDELWGPTAIPIREDVAPYVVRHGHGYSIFEHTSHGISLELTQYVPVDDSIKISRLKIRNLSTRARRLSITAYVEWVLGTSRGASAPFIVTEIEPETHAILARNSFSTEYGSRIAFADLNGQQRSWTADRTEFLGRNGTLDNPAALADGNPLYARAGAAIDPCAALQTTLSLRPNAVTEVVFLLGEAATRAEAISSIKKYRDADLDSVLAAAVHQWHGLLDTVQVKTPDRSMDVMLNRWLLYQTLACRVWARSAFYQAGGAYGFRDQLQDVMALTVAQPATAREQLIRAAARQFVAGDVQHWWLPPAGQGVRTRIADDRVWLPFAVAHYIEVTGELGILDETVPFLDGPELHAGQDESYFQPTISEQRGTIFEHCARALDHSLAVGIHGIPLFGSGDWNDGMNRVGEAGKGESIWLGWFLYTTLLAFAPLADIRREDARASTWRRRANSLAGSLEREGWDGNWYRRGYFDDGTALGSAGNLECRIDSIAQSWSVISGAGSPVRAAAAMAAVDEYLVRREDGLVLLFTPPFDHTPLDPGYIKGYPPGIRENGGQYTHGALWSVIAFAMLGDGDKAGELFSLLNPINHANTRAGIHRYKVEPYVACADVYSMPPHVGRGGWTWYTGSAGWMYRTGLEWILGFRLRGKTLLIDPCIPRKWPGFEIVYRYGSTRYEIVVENPRSVSRGVSSVELDGKALAGRPAQIALADDGITHRVRIILG